ncbi:c-type cytochrome [Mesorhizobium sp. CA5]|uniref:c-type cytochrome n=1 Tax=Mesorhizobium sp. CA5 TaxID=2876638 RepID=UPI001CD16F9E|nr:c-type cytochrome [Mesorhizobium sp. CA5]MBZ9841515.1 c-type cytochrome [Mesorhizobium sp. CA5]
MSANAGLLVGFAFWFLAYASNWVAAEELGHQQAKVVELSLFLSNGCGACHTIRGTEARGSIGPDLSHVGSRSAIGAGVLPNTEEAIARFVARPDLFKPGVKMPAFDMLPQTEIQAIARYLKALK